MAANEQYPELDSVEECPKCGTGFDGAAQPDLHYGCKAANRADGLYMVMDEWIRRTCPTCSFQWREACVK